MNCRDFRRAAGADPGHLPAEAEAHRAGCPDCTRYYTEIVELEARLVRALSVPVPEARGAKVRAFAARGRWLALAASVLVAVGIGAAGWLVLVPASLAADVVEHMRGEPDAWNATTPATDAALEASLQRGNAWFTKMPGRFVYVQSCFFRGRHVPHLVMQTAEGPITLLILRHERVRERQEFDEGGYRGVLLPVEDGSVAVVTHGAPLPVALANEIAASIEWTTS